MQQKKNGNTTTQLPAPHMQLFTTLEVAAILNVSLRTVQTWIRDGTLPHMRLGVGGRLIRVSATDLDNFIKEKYNSSNQAGR